MEADELSIGADLMSVRTACGFVRRRAGGAGLSDEGAAELELAVDEICTNIVMHGYRGKEGTIDLLVDSGQGAVKVTIVDRAVPFNPLRFTPPDTSVPLSEREIGRMGLLIARKMVDDISYERADGENRLTMMKIVKREQYV